MSDPLFNAPTQDVAPAQRGPAPALSAEAAAELSRPQRPPNPAANQPTFRQSEPIPGMEKQTFRRNGAAPEQNPVEGLRSELQQVRETAAREVAEAKQAAAHLAGMVQATQNFVAQNAAAQPAQAPQQAYYQPPPPPHEQNPDELLVDGKKLQDFVHKNMAYAVDRALEQVAPLGQWAQQRQSVDAMHQAFIEEAVTDRTQTMLESQHGVSGEQFRRLLPQVRTMLTQSQADPAAQAAVLTNPDALRWGTLMLMSNQGIPTQAASAPRRGAPISPPRGTGDAGAPGGAKPAAIEQAERRFGVKIPENKWRDNPIFQRKR